MLGERFVCPTCGTKNIRAALQAALTDAKKAFPPNLDFFDFGDGVTTMPIPDPQTGSYKTASIFYIFDGDVNNPDPAKRTLGRVLGVEFRTPWGVRPSELYDVILEKALKAMEQFEEKAVPIKDGDALPRAIEVL